MKVICNDARIELQQQGQSELQVLQRTRHWKETIDLVDCFTDAQGNQYFLTKKPKMNLLDFVNSFGPNKSIKIDDIIQCIKKLAKAFSRLHAKGIIHRDVCLENIIAKPFMAKKDRNARGQKIYKGLKLQIAGFDLAFCLKNDCFQVTQRFNLTCREFAPEITAGLAHGPPADVWGLGRVAIEMMGRVMESGGEIPEQSQNPLYALALTMVQEDQEARPTMEQVHQAIQEMSQSQERE